MRSAVVDIVKTRGVRGLYVGLSPTLVEIIPYAGLQFGTYDTFKWWTMVGCCIIWILRYICFLNYLILVCYLLIFDILITHAYSDIVNLYLMSAGACFML